MGYFVLCAAIKLMIIIIWLCDRNSLTEREKQMIAIGIWDRDFSRLTFTCWPESQKFHTSLYECENENYDNCVLMQLALIVQIQKRKKLWKNVQTIGKWMLGDPRCKHLTSANCAKCYWSGLYICCADWPTMKSRFVFHFATRVARFDL